ncbi:hypothetical protein ACJ7V3_01870 [Halomonas elongata]|uniref:hypothetical protein n=1 Tax=Halomonas elongata TaxID=2746 RepID=UPI0038D4F914
MPHFLRFSPGLETRLERLAERTGLSKAELIDRLVSDGVDALETELMFEDAPRYPRAELSIDQLLRESGLGI